MSTVTQKFQTTISKDVRKELGINPSDKLVLFEESPGKFLLMREDDFINEIAGICKDICETVNESRKGFAPKKLT